MKKFLLKVVIIIAALLIGLFGAKHAFASDIREQKVAAYLSKHNSPLAYFAGHFVAEADANGFDYRLLPAIAGVESTFCRNYIRGTFNCWGWGVGKIPFESWEDAISHISLKLNKNYIARGAVSVEQIGRIYCPPTHESWSKKVNFFMKQIEEMEVNYDAPIKIATKVDSQFLADELTLTL